jgi:hypothetical protein
MQKGLNNYGSFVTFNFFNMNKNQCVWKIPSKVLSLEIYGFDCRTNLWEYQCWNKIKLWCICQIIGGIIILSSSHVLQHTNTYHSTHYDTLLTTYHWRKQWPTNCSSNLIQKLKKHHFNNTSNFKKKSWSHKLLHAKSTHQKWKTSNINDGRFMNHLVISNFSRHKSASWCKSSSGHWSWYVSGLLKRCWIAIFFILDLQGSKCSLPLWSASQSRYLNYNNDAHKQVGIKNDKHIRYLVIVLFSSTPHLYIC